MKTKRRTHPGVQPALEDRGNRDGRPAEGRGQGPDGSVGHVPPDHHLVTGGIPMFGFPVLGATKAPASSSRSVRGRGGAVGDHVVMSFIPSCGKCPSCQAGLRNLCDLGAGLLAGTAISDGTHRIHTADGHPVFLMTLLGTFSPLHGRARILGGADSRDIPFEVACLVGCGVTTGYGSATHTAQIKPGEDVAIVGVGGVGMSAPAGRGQLRRPLHLRHRPGGVEARPGAEVRRHPRLRGHQCRDGGHRRGDRRLHGQEGDRHRRRGARGRRRQT